MEMAKFEIAEARGEVRKLLRCSGTLLRKTTPPAKVRTVDISLGGMCIMAPAMLAAGELCGLMFDATIRGKTQKVEVLARVAYCICVGTAGFRVGLQFTEVPDASRVAISQLAE